jgi:hypothetical protein
MRKTRLFYIAKFNSSRLKYYDYNIECDFEEMRMNAEIVSLADNEVLRAIRRINKKDIDFDMLDVLLKRRYKLRRQDDDNNKKIKELNKIINEIMYIPEYITVVINHNAHYKDMYENGLIVNGKRYVRFNASAGQARLSTVVFIYEGIINELNEIMDNGRDMSKPLSPSKYNAYKGLACSSTFVVSEPRYCVIPDYYSDTVMEVDFVTETEGDNDDIIERRTITQGFNRFDGMGLISPQQAKKWSSELQLDYIPAQWCVRNNFLKGMLCTFDIHKFCEEKNNGNYIIKSIYGKEVDLRNIDIIITESQFKLWDSFKSQEQYDNNRRKNCLKWGVTLVTPRIDKDILKMNYQFLQTLNLNDEDIEKLCNKFVHWIDGVSGQDVNYTLLFLLGLNNDEDSMRKKFEYEPNAWLTSLTVCHDLIRDKFIRQRVFDTIRKRIRDASLGVIIVDGNYQVIVSDPYAFMEHVCGHEVKGILVRNKYYSNYWNEKGIDLVDAMRAPLTSRSEHVKLELKKNKDTEEWYKYCYTGVILNVHGHETCNFAGSDQKVALCSNV